MGPDRLLDLNNGSYSIPASHAFSPRSRRHRKWPTEEVKEKRLIAGPPWVHRFGRNLLIIDMTALPSGGSNWNIKVFEHVNGSRYALHEEDSSNCRSRRKSKLVVQTMSKGIVQNSL